MWFQKDGETHERRSRSSFFRQRIVDGVVLSAPGSGAL
jgi:hypothetical protein